MWCWSCGSQDSALMMESSEITVILRMPSSWSPSAGGEFGMFGGGIWPNFVHWFFYFKFIYSYSWLLTACKLALCLREIPLELRQRARGGQVNLDMEDHRDEDFTKSKPAFRAFTGEGQKLGRWASALCTFHFLFKVQLPHNNHSDYIKQQHMQCNEWYFELNIWGH